MIPIITCWADIHNLPDSPTHSVKASEMSAWLVPHNGGMAKYLTTHHLDPQFIKQAEATLKSCSFEVEIRIPEPTPTPRIPPSRTQTSIQMKPQTTSIIAALIMTTLGLILIRCCAPTYHIHCHDTLEHR